MRSDFVIPANVGTEKDPSYQFLDPKSYGLLHGHIYITGTVIPDTAEAVLDAFNYLNGTTLPKIVVYINSNGGCLASAFSIMDTIACSKKPVATVNFSMAASAAALILMTGTKGLRYSYPNARAMIHCASTEVSGNVHEIEEGYKDLFYQNKVFLEKIAFYTGRTYEEVKEATLRDYYMSPSQAKKFGLIDKIITPKNGVL